MLPCEPIAVNAWRRSKSSRHGRAVRWKRSRITIGFGITATLSSPTRPGRSADLRLASTGRQADRSWHASVGGVIACELDGNRTFLVIERGVRDAAGNLDLAALLVQSCSAGEDASVGGLRPRSVTRKGRGLEIGVMLLDRDASDQLRDSRVSGPSMLFKQARPVRKRSAMRLIRGAASRPGIVGDLRCFATVGCILEPVERADRFSEVCPIGA